MRVAPVGFTLLEILVALVVGGMAVAGAATLLLAIGDRAQAVERAAGPWDRAANAEDLLRRTVANLAPSTDTVAPSFTGDPRRARFVTWCTRPEGWLGRCPVDLTFTGGRDSTSLQLTLDRRNPVVIREHLQRGQFRYFIVVDGVGEWHDRWTHLVPPRAVAVILDADTLFLPVWPNG